MYFNNYFNSFGNEYIDSIPMLCSAFPFPNYYISFQKKKNISAYYLNSSVNPLRMKSISVVVIVLHFFNTITSALFT